MKVPRFKILASRPRGRNDFESDSKIGSTDFGQIGGMSQDFGQIGHSNKTQSGFIGNS